MLPCDNICHTLKLLGIKPKQVYTKYSADAQQLLCVDGGLIVEPLQCATIHVQLLGKPLVCMVLTAQFVADKVAYVYLHSGYYCALGYRIRTNISTTADKKEGEQSRLQCAVVENYLQE